MIKTALLCLILFAAGTALLSAETMEVWNFDTGIFNALGGGYNQFGKEPSDCFLQLVSDVRRGDGGRSLKMSWKKEEPGYCGVWVHLFDENATPEQRSFVDTRKYPYLSFWVKGAKGGEDFDVQMADPEWLRKDDSVSAGPVSKYLKGPITTNWQEVVVPFEDFMLAEPQAAVLTLNGTGAGENEVFIDDLRFKSAADEPAPAGSSTVIAVPPSRKIVKAWWVWETKELLSKADLRKEFFAFCDQQKVDELFLQLVYVFKPLSNGGGGCAILRPDALAELIRECTRRNIRVHALDGYPEFVLETQHDKPLAIVDAVIRYNEGVEPDARFFGIHMDNEPYQIMGFEGPQRNAILEQFLKLNTRIMSLLKEKQSGMVYGIDIPMWFDEANPPLVITYQGKTQDMARHLIDIVDNVGIMDYRTFAGGMDGIIHHAEGEIDYADKAGKKVYIGVETFKYEPTPIVFIYGLPESDWQALQAGSSPLLSLSNVNDFKARSITDGNRRFLGISPPVPLKQGGVFTNALNKLYREFGATAQGRTADLAELRDAAQQMIETNPEYGGFDEFMVKDKDGNLLSAGFATTEYMLDKITFAGKTKTRLNAVLNEVEAYYLPHPSFHGFAIHYYSTFKAMKD
ncbi:MAG: hypothetical protein V2A34_00110 [Lentisphaerota bacterium]